MTSTAALIQKQASGCHSPPPVHKAQSACCLARLQGTQCSCPPHIPVLHWSPEVMALGGDVAMNVALSCMGSPPRDHTTATAGTLLPCPRAHPTPAFLLHPRLASVLASFRTSFLLGFTLFDNLAAFHRARTVVRRHHAGHRQVSLGARWPITHMSQNSQTQAALSCTFWLCSDPGVSQAPGGMAPSRLQVAGEKPWDLKAGDCIEGLRSITRARGGRA